MLILNLFVSHIIDLSTHCTTINDASARFLYHLIHGRKIDLESYIYTLISTLGFQTGKRHTTIFPSLISGSCEEAGVQISAAELAIKCKGPINRCTSCGGSTSHREAVSRRACSSTPASRASACCTSYRHSFHATTNSRRLG
ncbi:Uncharacterized protein Adt_03637 [Abeliophyllum distichum]|uniref:Uncharacterized protein n=1 Tax=Abeliophyllum distichum TaxID=126358 RepID=A0ABD1VZ48_9LAMI